MANKSFWQRPEGVTGALFLVGAGVGAVLLADKILPILNNIVSSTVSLAAGLAVLAGLVYVVLDPKMRNLVWYAYKSLMRAITGIFVEINPIAILKSYIEDLEDNLRKMSKQIGALRGQMRTLQGTYDTNAKDIQTQMKLAEQAQKSGDERNVTLAARKAGRLQEANAKYEVLLGKMDILYKMLTRMYENSEIMLEDTRDQVQIRIQEYEAIKTSNSAIRSAMSILKGDPDQRALFDQATEALVDDLSLKVGEMERFMDTSRNLMASIDLQNGVFEEDGLRLLEEWERKGSILSAPASAGKKEKNDPGPALDLNQPRPEPLKQDAAPNRYSDLFD
jgi:phage shock protein A